MNSDLAGVGHAHAEGRLPLPARDHAGVDSGAGIEGGRQGFRGCLGALGQAGRIERRAQHRGGIVGEILETAGEGEIRAEGGVGLLEPFDQLGRLGEAGGGIRHTVGGKQDARLKCLELESMAAI